MAELELGPAHPSEAPAIAEMSRDLVEVQLGWSWRAPRVVRHILDPDCEVVVARLDGRVVGFAIMSYGQDRAHLALLAVAPEHRRGGLGRRLLAWVERMASELGCSRISLEVRRINLGARAFYRSLGYREAALVPRYYGGREAAVKMHLDLRARG